MPQARDEAGNIWETDAQGNAVRLLQPAQTSAPRTIGTPDPAYQYKGPQAQADISKTGAMTGEYQANADRAKTSADLTRATMEPVVAEAVAKATKAEKDAQQASQQKSSALAQFNAAKLLQEQTGNLQNKFDAGPGKTHGIMGFQDYLPTEANTAFDQAAATARGPIFQALGLIGSQANTGKEAEMWTGPYIPSSYSYDSNIQNSLGYLRQQSDNAYRTAIQKLGGIPDENGNVHAIGTPEAGQLMKRYGITPQMLGMAAPDNKGAVAGNPPADNVPPPGSGPIPGAGSGGTGIGGMAANQPYVTKQDLALAGAVNGAYHAKGTTLADLVKAAKAQGYTPVPTDLKQWQDAIDYRNRTGGFVDVTPRATGQHTALEKAMGTAATGTIGGVSPGSAIAGATNMAGLGLVQALAPDQYAGMSAVNPGSTMAGEIGGALAGTEGLAALGRAATEKTLGKVAPDIASRVLADAKWANLARNTATDTAYGAGYGQTTQGDPVSGAIAGGVGSVAGQAAGSALGRTIGGIRRIPHSQALMDAGVTDQTIGQQLGGPVRAVEDRLSGLPILGDIINRRRLSGIQQWDNAVLNRGVEPVGGNVNEIGKAGLDVAGDTVGNAYDNATQGTNVPFDPQFPIDMQGVTVKAGMLPPDYAAKFDKVGENRIGPLLDRGGMTGQDYQQAMRGLKASRRSAASAAPGFEQEYRDALTAAMDALKGQMQRGGGKSVTEGLAKADAANRNVKTIADAMHRARNGSRSGESYTFMPSQLNDAMAATNRKYPGPNPFADLIESGQAILPNSVPDSGTAGRLATLALPGILGGAGAGAGYAGGETGTGTTGGLALGALLALGGTKAGQAIIRKAIMDRPKALSDVGTLIRKRKGLFGSAALPLALESQN